MKEYRVYAALDESYKLVGSHLDNVEAVKLTGKLVHRYPDKHILVIEHDFDMNADFPVYLNYDKGESFPKFKEKVLKRW